MFSWSHFFMKGNVPFILSVGAHHTIINIINIHNIHRTFTATEIHAVCFSQSQSSHSVAVLGGFRCLVHGAVAKRVGVVTGGPTGRTHVLAENRTDDLAAVVLQHMGGVELTSLAVLLAQCAGLLIEGENRSARVNQSAPHHSLVLEILQGGPELVELCI